ncbi:MAG: metallophosphoesterase [Candidatus Brocadiaceae bacterium]|nr:metallophosphoesterase [Candidatus Brocadiaceae bacterium]
MRGKPQTKHHSIARVIRDASPDFILFSGDMIYHNEFGQFLEVINRNYGKEKMIPLYPVIGNHELIFGEKVDILIEKISKEMAAAHNAQGQLSPHSKPADNVLLLWNELFQKLASFTEKELKLRSRQVLCEEIRDKLNPSYALYLREVLAKTTEQQSWYSFMKEVDGLKIQFIALNSSLPDDEEQYQWFLNRLKQFSGPKIIFGHYPFYSIGFHGCTDLLNSASQAARFRDRYAAICNDIAHNVALVISGHEHNYQRFSKVDKTGQVQLPVYLVSGGGGARLSGQGRCDTSKIPLDGFQCIMLTPAYHFVEIVASSDNRKNVRLHCKVLGLRHDVTTNVPEDDAFARQFVKNNLEIIDEFTLGLHK